MEIGKTNISPLKKITVGNIKPRYKCIDCGYETSYCKTGCKKCNKKKRDSKIIDKDYKYFKVLELNYYTPKGNKTRREFAKCQCNCGEIFETRADNLHRTKGCVPCAYAYMGKKNTLPNNESSKRTFYSSYISNANSRNLIFNLSREKFDLLISENCFYCGEPPTISNYLSKTSKHKDDFYCNGIDRLDNTLGYFEENCVTCCTDCNMMKKKMNIDNFKEKIIKIYKHLNLK